MDNSSFTDWDFTTITLGAARGFITESSGKSRTLSFSGLRQAILGHSSLLLCHRLNVARRLRIDTFPAFDVLELFAFVHPAVQCIPTPRGLAMALGMRKPGSDFEEGEILKLATSTLLETLYNSDPIKEPDILAVAETMRNGKWEWAEKVCATLRHHREEEEQHRGERERRFPHRGLGRAGAARGAEVRRARAARPAASARRGIPPADCGGCERGRHA